MTIRKYSLIRFPVVDPASQESLEREKRGNEIAARFKENEAKEKIRVEEYYRNNPFLSANNQGVGNITGSTIFSDKYSESRWSINPEKSIKASCAATTEPEKIVWGLPDWLPLKKLTILAGPRKSGKSLIACSIAARFSQGESHPSWPGQKTNGWGNVLIYSTEDDFADTIIPRLIAAGANLERIFNIDGISRFCPSRPFSFADENDVESLCAFAKRIGDVHLIILDPASLAVKWDASSNAKAQDGYVKIGMLAKRLNAAILGIAHVVKASKGKGALARVSGPLAMCGVARVVMVTAKIEG